MLTIKFKNNPATPKKEANKPKFPEPKEIAKVRINPKTNNIKEVIERYPSLNKCAKANKIPVATLHDSIRLKRDIYGFRYVYCTQLC